MQNIIETNKNLIETHCKVCNKIYLRDSFDRNPEYWICPECKKAKKKEKELLNLEKIKQQRLEERNYESYICWTCGNPFIEDYRKDIKKVKKEEPRFCCKECAAKYSSDHLDRTQTKLVECTICHELKEAPMNASAINFNCDDCKKENPFLDPDKKAYFKYRLKEKNIEFTEETFYEAYNSFTKRNTYKYPENCVLGKFERGNALKQKSANLQKLGFNFNNPNWEEEFFKIRNFLYDLYYKQKLSANEISQKYDLQINTPKRLLKLFGFEKFRDISDSLINAIKQGKMDPVSSLPNSENNLYNFKTGTYKLKTGEEYFYRSGYELWMMQFLEARDIKFTLNKFHISYISSEDNREHNGYPDFYLPDYNVLIETKGEDTYDEQNLTDRYETAIKKLGIDFIIVGCKAKYDKKNHCDKFRKWTLLKSFLTDKEKEKQILELLEIK